MPPAFRGVITEVNLDKSGAPTYTFDVRPLSGELSGPGRDGTFEAVPLLQAGFGDPGAPTKTGVVYVPTVGSRVVCIHDGVQFVIAGFMTGPVVTSETDREQRLVKFNPGISEALDRVTSNLPDVGSLPALFGLQPGEMALLSAGGSIKACVWGALIGADAHCLDLYVYDTGEILRKALGHRTVESGFQETCLSKPGATVSTRELPPSEQIGSIGSSTVHTRIFEATPYPGSSKPFAIEQNGHVTEGLQRDGKSAINAHVSTDEVMAEERRGFFTIRRYAIVIPPASPQPQSADELATDHFEVYDHQTDTDGSWRIKAGNPNKTVGAWTASSSIADLTIEYSARTRTFTIKSLPFTLSVDTRSGKVKAVAKDEVSVESAKKIIAKVGGTEATLSPSQLKMRSSEVIIDAPRIKLNGEVEVSQSLTAQVDVKAGIVSLVNHTHAGSWGGGSGTVLAPGVPLRP